jgi:very-short-patch-repair endonuclease
MARERRRRPPRSHRPDPATRSPEAAADAIAARQHGLVTRRQLLDAGVSTLVIDRRVQAGRLVPAFRGVYQVGPLRSPRTREMAALLACGPEAVVSHESAGSLWELGGPRPPGRVVHIGLRRGKRRSRRGIRLHGLPTLIDSDVSAVDGLRVTTATRTLLDMAVRWPSRTLERAVADALDRGLTTVDALRGMLARHPGRAGTRRLRLLLSSEGPALTRSELEALFLAKIRKAGVPSPRTNVRICDYEVDVFWPDARLVVELDGYEHHARRSAFEGDRIRDAELAARGIRVMRVTWHELTRAPEAVLVRLGGALIAPSGGAAWTTP